MRTALIMYLIWSMVIIFAGSYIYNKMMNTNDPSSIASGFKRLEETIKNENP